MVSERAVGIVLHTNPVTESSLIVTWFTREFGKLKTLAKGARRPKSPFRGSLDLFYRDELVFGRSKRSDLHTLQECFLEEPHAGLRQSVTRLTRASFACELVDLATEWEDPQPVVFDLLDQVLTDVETDAAPALLIWFQLHLLKALGWAPRWEKTDGSARILCALSGTSRRAARRMRLTTAQIADASRQLQQFWLRHVGSAPSVRVETALAAKMELT
ncbi:MAG: DNA repair protein RecO [Verrucomicrobiae bacterium]|nr:DNA repair protein RecO [Verrucomicrobiae bacterium]